MTHFFFFQDVMQSNVIKYMIISKQSLLNPVTMRFFALFYYVAVADEKYFNHISKTPCICCISLIYRLFLYISISSCQWHIVV